MINDEHREVEIVEIIEDKKVESCKMIEDKKVESCETIQDKKAESCEIIEEIIESYELIKEETITSSAAVRTGLLWLDNTSTSLHVRFESNSIHHQLQYCS